MNYDIVRTDRRTLAIYVLPDGRVEVRSPKTLSREYIDEFVHRKKNWIEKKQNQIVKPSEIDFDSIIYIFGEGYQIYIGTPGFDGKAFYAREQSIQKDTEGSLKAIAKRILIEKVDELSKITGLRPTSVKISSAKTRWGSCSGKNAINLNWRLIMGSEMACNYVIIHELSHIKEHNHSKKFWQIVSNFMPEYKSCEAELKILQKRLVAEGWM